MKTPEGHCSFTVPPDTPENLWFSDVFKDKEMEGRFRDFNLNF